MNYRVTYLEKNGQPAKPVVFGDAKLAASFAARSRKGKVEPIDGDAVATATVTTCPKADAAMVIDATHRYYERHWNPRSGRATEHDDVSAEQRDELYVESVCQARLGGASLSDALDDARAIAAAA